MFSAHHETGNTKRSTSPPSWVPVGILGGVECRAGVVVPSSMAYLDRDRRPVTD